MDIRFSSAVERAIKGRFPVVALESTVISHGLPSPENLQTAIAVEEIVSESGATPATIGILDGTVRCGLERDEIERFARSENIRKASIRDLSICVGKGLSGATTVASTASVAHAASIKVFATGGIGGVHRGYAADVSADLPELAKTPITVVCSGPKIILDVAATREWLETYGITVLGWECDEMPGFYTRSTGLAVDERVGSAEEAASIIRGRDQIGVQSAVLITVPVPSENEIDPAEVESLLAEAVAEADARGIRGKSTTPFLLSYLVEKTEGRTLQANVALLKNNARVASAVALALSQN